MSKLENYKRVPINYPLLYNTIKEQKKTLTELAKAIGVSPSLFTRAKVTGLINPSVLLEIKKYIDIDIHAICPNIKFERIGNGRSTTSGRMRVDWKYVEELIKQEGYSTGRVSILMGKSESYLSGAKVVGGLSADMIVRLASILGVTPETIADYVEPDVAGIISMIDNQPF